MPHLCFALPELALEDLVLSFLCVLSLPCLTDTEGNGNNFPCLARDPPTPTSPASEHYGFSPSVENTDMTHCW